MRATWVRASWLVLVLTLGIAGATSASTLLGTTFDLGQEIVFRVEDASTWWWGWCCTTCDSSWVHEWRVVDACGQMVYAVTHDGPVASNAWQGRWTQINAQGHAVPAGQYRLIVNTSAGTLSRCFTLRDPCSTWWWGCGSWCACTGYVYGSGCSWYGSAYSWCACEEVRSITQCGCQTSLVFVDPCRESCYPYVWWGCRTCP